MRKDKGNKNNLVNFETPEKPRAKAQGNQNYKEALVKAKKYDELMRVIKTDKSMCELARDRTKEKGKLLRIGYLNGYNDGKRAGYEFIVDVLLKKYLEEI